MTDKINEMTKKSNHASDGCIQAHNTSTNYKTTDTIGDAGIYNGTINNSSIWYEDPRLSNLDCSQPERKHKHHKISQIDDDDRIEMKDMDLHIQPTHNGFALTYIQDGRSMFYAFNTLEELFNFIKDMGVMDLSSKEVADSV